MLRLIGARTIRKRFKHRSNRESREASPAEGLSKGWRFFPTYARA